MNIDAEHIPVTGIRAAENARNGETMEGYNNTYGSIDEYISQFSPGVREKLKRLRTVIRESAPDAEETISYRMPAFTLYGVLVYFAAHKSHIGFYPTPGGIEAFRQELSAYKVSKGSIQFPIDKPLPYELIGKIVEFRAAENKKRAEDKLKKKK